MLREITKRNGKIVCNDCQQDPCECVVEINGDDLNTTYEEHQSYG